MRYVRLQYVRTRNFRERSGAAVISQKPQHTNMRVFLLYEGHYHETQFVIGCFRRLIDAQQAAENIMKAHNVAPNNKERQYKETRLCHNEGAVAAWHDGRMYLEIVNQPLQTFRQWKATSGRAEASPVVSSSSESSSSESASQ